MKRQALWSSCRAPARKRRNITDGRTGGQGGLTQPPAVGPVHGHRHHRKRAESAKERGHGQPAGRHAKVVQVFSAAAMAAMACAMLVAQQRLGLDYDLLNHCRVVGTASKGGAACSQQAPAPNRRWVRPPFARTVLHPVAGDQGAMRCDCQKPARAAKWLLGSGRRQPGGRRRRRWEGTSAGLNKGTKLGQCDLLVKSQRALSVCTRDCVMRLSRHKHGGG